jgi:TolB protein
MLKNLRIINSLLKAFSLLMLINVTFFLCRNAFSQQSPVPSPPESQSLKDQLSRIIVRPGVGAAMAIADFAPLSQQSLAEAAQIHQVLFDDLEFAGVVNVISKSLYPQTKFDDPLKPDLSIWRADPVRADYLVLGTTLAASDQLIVELVLYDVQAGRRLLTNSYRGASPEARALAHRLADDVIKLLSGVDGIANSKIAYVSRQTGHREIFIVDYDGHSARQFTFERSMALFPHWSPDGKKIAYLSYLGDWPHIQIRSVTDGLPLGSFRFPRGTTSSPVFSPDGERLAFCSSKDSNSMQLYVADLRTQQVRQLTNTRSVIHTSLRWNPRTGREVAFISDRSGTPQIYMVDAEGGEPRRLLTLGGSADSPAWSHDGRYLAFTWRPPEASRYDIFVMDIASRQIVQLTSGPGSNESPSWSPDDRHLAFQSNRTGRFEIYLIHVDGTGLKQVTTSGGASPAWGR